MTIGNSVPPWKRTFLPLPFWASLAAFFVDDEETTRVRCYRRVAPMSPRSAPVAERPDQRLVGWSRRLPARPLPTTQSRPRRPIRAAERGIVDETP